MATTRTRTVKSSGGDYTSLSAWESGEQADLVTLDEIRVAECYAMSDTTAVDINGWTTDATRYIKITVPQAERHNGKWNTAKYRLEVSAADNSVLWVQEDFVRLEGLQVYNTSTGLYPGGVTVNATGATSTIYISHCIARSAVGTTYRQYGFTLKAATVYIWNCLAYDWLGSTDSVGFRQNLLSGGTAYCYNCTAHSCDRGFENGDNGADMIVKNCLAAGCSDGFIAGWAWPSGCDYNASDLASDAPGTNSRNSQTFTFVDAANDDFHLASTDAGAKDYGTDLSADANLAFSTDIDGQTRSGSWDIGADEYIASGTPVGQVTETDTAQSIAKRKAKAVGQSSETDTAQSITKKKTRSVGQPTEVDTAQAIAKRKTKSIGQVTETDTAQAITRATGITVSVGQVVETDTAQSIGKAKTKAIGQVTETDTAQAINENKSRTIGQPAETDTAQAIAKRKTKAVGQSVETDIAQSIIRFLPGVIAVGQVTETDTAFPITVVTAGIGGGGWRENRKRKPWPLPPPTFPLEEEEEEKKPEVQAPENKTAPHWLDGIEKRFLVTPRGLQYRPTPIEIEEIKQTPPAVKILHTSKTADDSDEILEAALSLKKMIRRRKEERIIYELIAQGKLQ